MSLAIMNSRGEKSQRSLLAEFEAHLANMECKQVRWFAQVFIQLTKRAC